MNCPSRTDPELPDGWNQNPNPLAADTTTRSDLGKLASARVQHDHKLKSQEGAGVELRAVGGPSEIEEEGKSVRARDGVSSSIAYPGFGEQMLEDTIGARRRDSRTPNPQLPRWQQPLDRARRGIWRYMKFIGPGFMIAVAYIDPGNYATDAAAGATYRFKLLFMVLLSNIFAIFLQSLCIRMSTVTGLDLAEMNKEHCPRWLNYLLYFFGEAAVIATDIAEVIGFAIALNLLAPKLPVVAGCAISILDVMFILLFYQPEGSMRALRAFECFVMFLVLGVVICFCYQLSLVKGATPGEVFKGYLPSSAIVQGQGLYQACGILGATVMPHSLYLGSGLVQPRLKDFDKKHDTYRTSLIVEQHADGPAAQKYRPSMAAIKGCMKYSIIELAISLFTFALFVNSAILIVCGASLYSVDGAQNADLFGIYNLLNQQIGHAAATVFAVALLLSGCSAGIVCTMAGQMISEGQLNWKLKPWVTRLLTRSISIVPAILVAGTIGKKGLSEALVGSQVALSVILPFVTAPLIYYTCRNKYMWVYSDVVERNADEEERAQPRIVHMKNHWLVMVLAIIIWLIIVIMNVANIVLTGLGVN
ncbi:uncharacterized protein MYCFIDRAFT_53810 [Pseudocercospora fijiensis CIRAD86]|uniref:Uncharacterized protein n=1 Tax=Pseudocercospora fijiensis (strain CIRAD86) TaxID=383855 RepID=M2Z214_PSEFD|nr:uncharacterized protein MYCFIDRAFT_53810 [Pseudocercospora fijiensis CIRAD86]EME83860.1 hypothetical protein MYCFIDRAFT_53810 [Pseudocercospora fijiensis CIRAD86]